MTPEQKLELALRLEALGVDNIESGFPASSPSEAEATRLIAKGLTRARFTTFCRAVEADITSAVEAGGTRGHEVQILATSSDLHLVHKRRIGRNEAVAEVARTVRFACSFGVDAVSVALEDVTRGEPELLRALLEAALDNGASAFVVADTSGCTVPEEYGELVAQIRQWAPPPARISTHCHDDLGLSLANAVAGLQAGADEVQATLGGIGERAGNTALEQLVATLHYKSEPLGLYTEIDSGGLYEAYGVLRGIIGLGEPRTKPIFGSYAFATAAGIHQQGILRKPETYEYVQPDRFGRERSLLVGRHSGRSVLHHLLRELGVELGPQRTDDLYRRHVLDRPNGECQEISALRSRLIEELS